MLKLHGEPLTRESCPERGVLLGWALPLMDVNQEDFHHVCIRSIQRCFETAAACLSVVKAGFVDPAYSPELQDESLLSINQFDYP